MSISPLSYPVYQFYQVAALLTAPRLFEQIHHVNEEYDAAIVQIDQDLNKLNLIQPLDKQKWDWDSDKEGKSVQKPEDNITLPNKIKLLIKIKLFADKTEREFSILTRGFTSPLLENRALALEIEYVNQKIKILKTCCIENIKEYNKIWQRAAAGVSGGT